MNSSPSTSNDASSNDFANLSLIDTIVSFIADQVDDSVLSSIVGTNVELASQSLQELEAEGQLLMSIHPPLIQVNLPEQSDKLLTSYFKPDQVEPFQQLIQVTEPTAATSSFIDHPHLLPAEMRVPKVSPGSSCHLSLPVLPLESLETLESLNENLKKSPTLRQKLVRHLLEAKGDSFRQCHKRVMYKLMREKVRLKLNWAGQRGSKLSYSSYKEVRAVVNEVVPKTLCPPKWDEKMHEAFDKEHLKRTASTTFKKRSRQSGSFDKLDTSRS